MSEEPAGLTRLTVNLTARAVGALEFAANETGDNRTDCVNRALQIYGFLLDQQAQGAVIYLRKEEGDKEVFERIRFV